MLRGSVAAFSMGGSEPLTLTERAFSLPLVMVNYGSYAVWKSVVPHQSNT